MAYDYYYNDRYDAPCFEDEESLDWWDFLGREVMDWMTTVDDPVLDETQGDFSLELIEEYTDKFINQHADKVCELYDRWLDRFYG
ncbi:MAG: hypothetical protein ACK5S6_00240 [bacterium]|jgi:hypothetical protein